MWGGGHLIQLSILDILKGQSPVHRCVPRHSNVMWPEVSPVEFHQLTHFTKTNIPHGVYTLVWLILSRRTSCHRGNDIV